MQSAQPPALHPVRTRRKWHPQWLLARLSRTYRSTQIHARVGARYTRWTVPAHASTAVGKDWHGLTAIGIATANAGTWPEQELAALTARLCQQAAC
ncbi:RNaseH domain-containing protein [Nocardia sp. SC052]|uniref:RNaseH domain-containing protein n=1 Tax=Nocardia sichangensis TaxID=3385975 RepID=UPI0039A0287D